MPSWKIKLHDIIYEADTPAGKAFDVILLFVIIASIILVMLESVKSIDLKYHSFLNISEWVITILFTIEYIARIITVKKTYKIYHKFLWHYRFFVYNTKVFIFFRNRTSLISGF